MCRSVVQAACAAFVLLFAASPLFANEPPAAQPQTVSTQGSEPLEIVLRGSDPEGGDLRFEIVEPPQSGSLSDPEPIVPKEEIDPRTGEPFQPPITSGRVVYRADSEKPDSFTFSVIDPEGASGMATVTINPPSQEPPPPPIETVIAHDTEANVFRDTQAVLTLTGASPEGVSLRFRLLSTPSHGDVGELTQASDRTATLPYSPEREYIGEDGFEFEACGEINGNTVCDDARYRINVIERPQEPRRLVSDVQTKTPVNKDVRFSLANDPRPPVEGPTVVLDAIIAGNVADSDRDGKGDNRNDLPGPEPLFMRGGVEQDGGPGATGTARMHIEWNLEKLKEVNEIAGAEVLLHTRRASKEGVTTKFFATASDGDGELSERDFEWDAEHIPGAVMPMPSLEQMPVDEEGTFTFDVLGELRDAVSSGFRVFSVQGRIDDEEQKERAAGLDVRTSAFENLERELAPQLIIKTANRPAALTYTVDSLPDVGTLKDDLGNVIKEVPYRLPNANVVYIPPAGHLGQVSFTFSGTDGVFVDIARATITIFFGRCEEDADFCFNGR